MFLVSICRICLCTWLRFLQIGQCLRGFARGDPQESLESGHRCFPAIETEDKFVEVSLQVFWVNSMMRTIEPCLEIAESPVNVRRPRSWRLPVAIVRKRGFGVPFPAIGPNRRSFGCILHQKLPYRLLISLSCNGQADTACPLCSFSTFVDIADHFNSPENQRFCSHSGHASAAFPLNGASHDRFIGFNVPLQAGSCVTDHRTPQTVQHEPGGSVRASYLTFKLFGAEPRRVCRHQIGRPEPLLNAHMASMHRRASYWRCTPATRRALIPKRLLDYPILPAPTVWTHKSIRPPALRQVLPAGGVGRELPPKLPQRFRKPWPSHAAMMNNGRTLVKCISILNQLVKKSNRLLRP